MSYIDLELHDHQENTVKCYKLELEITRIVVFRRFRSFSEVSIHGIGAKCYTEEGYKRYAMPRYGRFRGFSDTRRV